MARNLDSSLESKKLQTELQPSCDKDEAVTDSTTSPPVATKKSKTFLSSLKATPLFSSSPLLNIATNIKNSLHSSRDARPPKIQAGGGDLNHKSSRSSSKQEVVPTCSPVSPVLRRRKSPTNTFTHSYKMSSNLFDPEEEEPIGPMFGVLRLTPSREELSMSNRESDISSVASVSSSKVPKSFLDRIKYSFGSRLSFGSATSRSTNTDSTMWWSRIGVRSLRESVSTGSPELPKRRNSIATFFKRNIGDHGLVESKKSGNLASFFRRSNTNPIRSRKSSDSFRPTARSSKRSKSLEMTRQARTRRPISVNVDVDFRDFGLSTDRGSFQDKDPEASLSWIWQEMGEKKTDTDMGFEAELEPVRFSNDSGDSGIGRSMTKDASYTSPDQVFGSIPELDDDVFLDMFKTQLQIPSSNLSFNHVEALMYTDPLERTKATDRIGTKPVLQCNSPISERALDQDLVSIPMSDGGGLSNVNSEATTEDDKIVRKIGRKTGKISIRTNPRTVWTPAGTNQTRADLDDQDVDIITQLKGQMVRNTIRTNPKAHWTPSSENNTEKVTSI